MNRRPELTILAGPNGAGKSRLCPLYVSTASFDGDKIMMILRREHPDWPDRWVSGTVASELEKQKTNALHIAKSNIHRVEDNPPQWFKLQFAEVFDKLNEIGK